MGRWMRGAAVKAAAIRLAGNMLTDGQALRAVAVFLPWDADKTYRAGERARFGGRLFRCTQNHDAQASWTPDAAPSLLFVEGKRGGKSGLVIEPPLVPNGEEWDAVYFRK